MVIETRSRSKDSKMMRSPEHGAGRDAKLREDVKQYRRTLQKISKMKTKILIALRDEGCPEASHMLQTPPTQSRAPRCRECGGCRILERVGPCMTCLDCRAEEDCLGTHQVVLWVETTGNYLRHGLNCDRSLFDLQRRGI